MYWNIETKTTKKKKKKTGQYSHFDEVLSDLLQPHILKIVYTYYV
jgi:hypothetical protein